MTTISVKSSLFSFLRVINGVLALTEIAEVPPETAA